MTILDGGWALQRAIYGALTTDPAVCPNIYDSAPPESPPYPHIELADEQGRNISAAALRAEERTVEIHIWSRYEGYYETRGLIAAVKDRLNEAALSLAPDASLIDIQFLNEDLMMDADGLTRHGIVRFSATLSVP